MRVLSWNLRRAKARSPLWAYLMEVEPDIALLQEVGGIPDVVRDRFHILEERAGTQSGSRQIFSTSLLSLYPVVGALPLASDRPWVQEQVEFFRGNLVSAALEGPGNAPVRVVSVHSPAWPVAPEKWQGKDVSDVKLAANPDIWCTEILWDCLRHMMPTVPGSWIVGGDFNSCETFDFGLVGDRGNREFRKRMERLGFTEALSHYNSRRVPTFKGPKQAEAVNQIDHLYVTAPLSRSIRSCVVGDWERAVGRGLSDHVPIVAEFGEPTVKTE
jgi:endonuclease/exonuclease/phosphatase family metal-dependent hydrolase